MGLSSGNSAVAHRASQRMIREFGFSAKRHSDQ